MEKVRSLKIARYEIRPNSKKIPRMCLRDLESKLNSEHLFWLVKRSQGLEIK